MNTTTTANTCPVCALLRTPCGMCEASQPQPKKPNLPSINRLALVFGERAQEARSLLEGSISPDTYPSVASWVSQCWNPPTKRDRLLRALDEIAETYGVEAIFENSSRMSPAFEYLNTGDPYAPTLIYDHDTNRFRVTSWGDIVERHPNKYA